MKLCSQVVCSQDILYTYNTPGTDYIFTTFLLKAQKSLSSYNINYLDLSEFWIDLVKEDESCYKHTSGFFFVRQQKQTHLRLISSGFQVQIIMHKTITCFHFNISLPMNRHHVCKYSFFKRCSRVLEVAL